MYLSGIAKAFLFCLLFLTAPLFAQQSRESLEKEKAATQKKIRETESILNQTRQKRSASLGKLAAIDQQIKSQEDLIGDIQAEISYIDGEIDDLDLVIISLEEDLQRLKKDYAEMLYSAYKTRVNINPIVFVFSASSFKDMWLRYQYLEQLAEMRKKQADLVISVTETLISQKDRLNASRTDKQKLLNEQLAERQQLTTLKNQQNNIIAELRERESELRTDLERRKKALTNLNNLIAEVIRKEIEAQKRATASATTALASASASFENLRNKMSWPVDNGFISRKFGNQPHPVLKRVTVNNLGVGIQTTSGQQVKAVYDGTVKVITKVPDMNTVVIVQHGDYRTVYCNLASCNMEIGDTIKAGQVIGTVYTDDDGVSELEFQLWKGTQKVDPEAWLAKK